DGTEQGTVMLADAPDAALPGYDQVTTLTVVGDTLYFEAHHPQTGRELWKTDGTPAGTSLVRDLSLANGQPVEFDGINHPSVMQGVGNTLYFTTGLQTGFQLWRSDGTSDGTTRVAALQGRAWDL